ncbi:MAG: MarR family transcriptional regulator [Veillonellaceae bacterium]|nr:MarR family transcriptional regulator [Veillonellaceae bacterium]
MRRDTMTYLTKKEEEFIDVLTDLGMKRTVAKVLIFLSNTPEATSRAIERETDLRQPEVSIAVHDLIERGWISNHESKPEGMGRPMKKYRLAKPFPQIIDIIETEKKQAANRQLRLLAKLREYLS